LIPKGANKAPILLTRTPYDADKLTSHAESSHLGPVLNGYDNALDVILEGGYIRVVQDIRGKHGSEGDYVVNRPLRGPLNKTPVDHATDTYDTIDGSSRTSRRRTVRSASWASRTTATFP
jgi:predicted acyl esterase